MIGLYPVHLHKLPPKEFSISSLVLGPDAIKAYMFITIPGEQNLSISQCLGLHNARFTSNSPTLGPIVVGQQLLDFMETV